MLGSQEDRERTSSGGQEHDTPDPAECGVCVCGGRERESVCVCVCGKRECVCVCVERECVESVCVEGKGVCVWKESVCVCVWGKRESVCVHALGERAWRVLLLSQQSSEAPL